MQFKESAGIFVMGLVLSVVGGVMSAGGVYGSLTYSITPSSYTQGVGASTYVQATDGGYGVLSSFGIVLGLIGLVQMSIGAYRALTKIDALPVPMAAAALTLPPEAHVQEVEAAETVDISPVPPISYSRPQTPRHLIYNGSIEQQPPIE